MAGFRIEGNTSGNVAEVDANNNLKTTLPSVVAQAGYVKLAGEISEATDPAGAVAHDIRMSSQGRLSVGQPVVFLNRVFNNTAIDTAVFNTAATTQTIVAGAGVVSLNGGSVTTVSTYSALKTNVFYPAYVDLGLYMVADVSLNVAPQVNNTVEIGLFQAATNAAPTDGVLFRYDSTGTLKAVLNNNGTEYTSAALTAPSSGVMHMYKIVLENDRALFYIDDACQAIIVAPTGLGFPTYANALPFQFRCINGGTAPASAVVPKLGSLFIGLQDSAGQYRPMEMLAALAGKMGSQGQEGHTQGSTALLTNSLAAGAGAAMTNTAASLGTGLGGQFAALPTLAVGTDGIVCSYQNPAATSAIPGKTLYIYGVTIQSAITTVLAGGPVVYEYSLAYGHTAVSLATTETLGTSKAPRRIALGLDNCGAPAANGAVGAIGQPVSRQFIAPIAVMPGEFVAVVAKNLGVVTTTGVVLFTVTFDAFWE